MNIHQTNTQKTFQSTEQVIERLTLEIESKGNPSLGGVEQEVMTLDRNGSIIPFSDEYQAFIANAVKNAGRLNNEEGKINFGNCLQGGQMITGGDLSYGAFNPETSTLITEFAHAAGTNAWHTLHASQMATQAIQESAEQSGYNIVALGLIPHADLDDIRGSGAVLPYAGYVFSYDNMRLNRNRHISQTTFGNASFHYNQGFNDPEQFIRYARVSLYLQPIMTAIMANSPIMKNQLTQDNGRVVKSIRSHLMQSYENYLGINDLSYSYPDFMLDFGNQFEQVVLGYMSQPLGRNIVNGEKMSVNGLTMSEYVSNGYLHNGEVHYPNDTSINMMFSEPVIDVRLRPFGGPRVETRAHDGGAYYMSASLSAFYRGINANLDSVEDFLKENISVSEIRRQRKDVCFTAMNGFAKMNNGKVISYQQFAEHIINLSIQGLNKRGLSEHLLLRPLQIIVETGKTFADCQIDFIQTRGGSLKSSDIPEFMSHFHYASVPMPNGQAYSAPIQKHVEQKAELRL